jgi:hypothetical protein
MTTVPPWRRRSSVATVVAAVVLSAAGAAAAYTYRRRKTADVTTGVPTATGGVPQPVTDVPSSADGAPPARDGVPLTGARTEHQEAVTVPLDTDKALWPRLTAAQKARHYLERQRRLGRDLATVTTAEIMRVSGAKESWAREVRRTSMHQEDVPGDFAL